MSEHVTTEIEGSIARVTFSNADLNFATIALLQKLADALEQLDREPQVRAIVLASQGKVFCAGADLVSDNGFGATTSDPLREFYDQAIRIFSARKPIIAMVQGAAIGAGLGLAVAADFRVAATNARFSANFTKLGFHPGFGLTFTLPRMIGHQRAARMFLTAARFKAEEVVEWGLVDHCCEAPDLNSVALSFAAEIAANAPLSLLSTRATLRGDFIQQVTQALTREHAEQIKLKDTEDFAEGVRAVAERRPGNFKGR